VQKFLINIVIPTEVGISAKYKSRFPFSREWHTLCRM